MDLESVGDPTTLELAYRLVDDPDGEGLGVERGSWGALRIVVAGKNLTRGRLGSGDLVDHAEVPLLPVVDWFLRSWDPLFHEGRLPTPGRALSSSEWYLDCMNRLPRSEEEIDRLMATRESWWCTHGLGAALPGFRIPDVHFRRVGGDLELSGDDREWRSVDGGVALVEQPGRVPLDAVGVAETIAAWCAVVLRACEDSVAADAAAGLRDRLDSLRDRTRQVERVKLAAGIDIERAARAIRAAAGVGGSIDRTVRTLLGLGAKQRPGLVARLPIPVLLYRSASPSLDEQDLHALLRLCESRSGDATELDELRRPSRPLGTAGEITDDGLERALEVREEMGIPLECFLTGAYDLESVLLPRLGVRVREVHLTDAGVDGAALVSSDFLPTVAVNQGGRCARTRWGRRFTLAHELCHLLYDGDPRAGVGVVSNPWADYASERRANAFAVMLLAPESAVEVVLDRDSDRWTPPDLRHAMRALGVGLSALTWHLHNLGWVTESERGYWVDALNDWSGGR